MAKSATTLTDVKEIEWTESFGTALAGIGLMVLGALLWYSTKFNWVVGSMRTAVRVGFGIAIFAGAAILALALARSLEAKRKPGAPYQCPYCDEVNLFPAAPTTDFDCEHCSRTIHFIDGVAVPVRTIICQACRADHRVPTNVDRYVCDKCNRPLKIAADPTQQMAAAAHDPTSAMLEDYDVVLLAIDRRRENDLAFKIQNLMVVNMPVARKLIATATPSTPLVVIGKVSQRKADAVRRQLQELGATAAIRPTNAAEPSAPRK